MPSSEADLTRSMARYDIADAAALIERKRVGERIGLDPEVLDAWRLRIEALFVQLDQARETSVLPEDPPNQREVRDWLLVVRRARFDIGYP